MNFKHFDNSKKKLDWNSIKMKKTQKTTKNFIQWVCFGDEFGSNCQV